MDTRYNSAMMDVILDLGYVLIYLVMVVLGMSELTSQGPPSQDRSESRRTEVQQQYLTKFLELLKFQCHNVSLVCSLCFFNLFKDSPFQHLLTDISPVFAFPSDMLQYLAVYDVCCTCRAVERTAQGHGRTESKAQQNISFRWTSWSPIWFRRFLQACYTPCVVVILVMLLRSEEVYLGHSNKLHLLPLSLLGKCRRVPP